jgi:hypothetical protein
MADETLYREGLKVTSLTQRDTSHYGVVKWNDPDFPGGVFDLTTDVGKAQLTMLMAAFLSGAPVTVWAWTKFEWHDELEPGPNHSLAKIVIGA